MGTQNWTDHFKEIFKARRGYDLTPYLPTLSGQIVESREVSERFLWDFRLTSQELVLENHARHLRDYAHRYGFGLSIEPYDMSPNNDIALGGIADVPMGETWRQKGQENDGAYGRHGRFRRPGSTTGRSSGPKRSPVRISTRANSGNSIPET